MDVALTPGEDFTLSGVKYRVMSDKNYSGYGYVYYEVVRDFTKANG
jgi:hypothetical protein